MEAFLASLYFFYGAAYLDSPPATPEGWYYAFDRTEIQNPYNIVGAGIEHEFNSRWSISFEVQHECSYPYGKDYGQNSARLFVKWRPFK